MKKATASNIYLLSLIPLFVGGIIYLSFRPDTLLMFRWTDKIGASGVIDILRTYSSNYMSALPGWVIYSLPNALWLMSFSLVMSITWRGNVRMATLWCSLLYALSLASELMQWYGLVRGTADIFDAIAYSAGFLVLFLINRKSIHEKENDCV